MKYTPNLQLFEYEDTIEDGSEKFLIKRALNDNWDKIDNAIGNYLKMQELLNQLYDAVYKIGQPIYRLDSTLYSNEIRLTGQDLLISSYPLLFEVYGFTYGKPQDTNYFTVPDMRDKGIYGGEAVNSFGYLVAGLPNITGTADFGNQSSIISKTGAFSNSATHGYAGYGDTPRGANNLYVSFNASQSNAIYGRCTNNVHPASVKVNWVTRFK